MVINPALTTAYQDGSLGGNEKTFSCPLRELAPDEIMKTLSYIWLLALLMLGNVLPSESIGRIVRLNLLRNPRHLCQDLNSKMFQRSTKRRPAHIKFLCTATALMQPARGSD
jgi:hypothetical protein